MTIEVALLISIVSVSFAFYFGLSNKKRNEVSDLKKDAIEAATINVKLDTINRGVDDIKLEQKSISKDIKELSDRVLVVEQSTKSAHHRIDDMIDKGK